MMAGSLTDYESGDLLLRMIDGGDGGSADVGRTVVVLFFCGGGRLQMTEVRLVCA